MREDANEHGEILLEHVVHALLPQREVVDVHQRHPFPALLEKLELQLRHLTTRPDLAGAFLSDIGTP